MGLPALALLRPTPRWQTDVIDMDAQTVKVRCHGSGGGAFLSKKGSKGSMSSGRGGKSPGKGSSSGAGQAKGDGNDRFDTVSSPSPVRASPSGVQRVNLRVVDATDLITDGTTSHAALLRVWQLTPASLAIRSQLVHALNVELGGLDGSAHTHDTAAFVSQYDAFNRPDAWTRKLITLSALVTTCGADGVFKWDTAVTVDTQMSDVLLIEVAGADSEAFPYYGAAVVLPEWYVSTASSLASCFYATAAADATGTEVSGRIGWGLDHGMPHHHWLYNPATPPGVQWNSYL